MNSPLEIFNGRNASDTAKLCFYELWRMVGRNKTCWPAQETLARAIGWSIRKLARAIAELKRLGVLRVKARPNRSAEYEIGHFSQPVAVPAPPARQARFDFGSPGSANYRQSPSKEEVPVEVPSSIERSISLSSIEEKVGPTSPDVIGEHVRAIPMEDGSQPGQECVQAAREAARVANLTPYQAGAALERARRRASRNAGQSESGPKGPGWFRAVILNAATGEDDRIFERMVEGLAAAKRFGDDPRRVA